MAEDNKKALDEASKMEAIKNMKSPAIIMNPNDYRKLLGEMNILTTSPPFYNGIPVHELSYIEEGKFFVYDMDIVTLQIALPKTVKQRTFLCSLLNVKKRFNALL